MSAPRGVLFDVDGVLLDSYAVYRRVWDRWSDENELDRAVVWAQTYGRRPVDTVQTVAPTLDPETAYVRLRELLSEESAAVGAYPGAAALLQTLPRSRWGIVTSGRRDTVLERFAAAGLPVPSVLVDAGRVQRGKPDPEGYLLGAREVDTAPACCLVVEDAPAGVTAGIAAGMHALGISTTHPGPALKAAGARRVEPHLVAAGPLIVAWALGAPLPAASG